MELRPYQTASIEAVQRGWPEHRRQLLVLPTGTGKTVVFAHVARLESELGGRTLVLAHRDELLRQAQDKLRAATGIASVLEKAGSRAWELYADHLYAPHRPPVVVGSVQTLNAARLKKWDRRAFDLIIVDEAHHSLAESYTKILDYFDARVLGVTATPDRGDKKNLGQVFSSIAYEYSLPQAIRDGYLSPIQAQLLPLEIDMSPDIVRTTAGDYNVGDLDHALEPCLERIAAETVKQIGARRTLVFLPLVRTSRMFTEILRRHGLKAEHIDGTSPDRHDILARYARGEFQVLSNSSLLLEGYDCPEIACVIILRPTQSRSLYCQMVGRGTRPAPGKSDLLLLDFLWQSATHRLCRPASLVATSQEEAEQMTEIIARAQGAFLDDDDDDLGTDLLEAQTEAQQARERSLARILKEQQAKKKKTMNPVAFALSIHAADLQDYEPVMSWEADPPTQKQLQTLANFGFDVESVMCKGHASLILEKIFDRRKLDLCSPKQAALLQRFGIDPTWVAFGEARRTIDSIVANGWRVPEALEVAQVTPPPDAALPEGSLDGIPEEELEEIPF